MNTAGATLTLINSTLSDKQAGTNVGVIFNYGNNVELKLSNNNVSGNVADYGGGGIINTSVTPTLVNTTVAGNNADTGGGILNLPDRRAR